MMDINTVADTIAFMDMDYFVSTSGNSLLISAICVSEISRYILTSCMSFSCGNLVLSELKESPNITLSDKTSGGGSCSVHPCMSASGADFVISRSLQISSLKNGS